MERCVLVTGGARGIGRAISQRLAELGYAVAIADWNAAAGRRTAAQLGVRFLRCDVSSEASVRRCVQATVKRFGRLDALVNNAGLADPVDPPVERLPLARWERRIAVNLTGAFLMTKHCVRELRRRKGAVVNIASTRALQSEPDTEAYAASKGGLVALTHALAISLGPRVRVNCISPGWIAEEPGAVSRKDHAQHPVGRVGRGADIADLVAYLISDAAGFVTGQNFAVDGGMTKKMIYV
ncbi:MAG TPA: SDR family oxidoreductase [Burkholderiales bacterium]|nr:SDR family oxidoreductase [Burkholderiales bacterium]